MCSVVAWGCNSSAPATPTPASALPAPMAINAGDTIQGTVSTDSPGCGYRLANTSRLWCAYEVSVSSTGMLTINVDSSLEYVVLVQHVGSTCCHQPLQVPIETAAPYRIEVAYTLTGVDPLDAPPFTLTTSLGPDTRVPEDFE